MSSKDGYAELRRAILSGTYEPNQRLIEADLIRDLGVPRGSVRLALMLLAHEGLVEHAPNRGARVRRVSVQEAIEILQARAALEGFAAREAAINAGPYEVAALREIIAEMRKHLDDGDFLGASERNPAFHGAIMRAARHQTIERLVDSLRSQLVRFQYRTVLAPGRSEGSYAEHAAIVEAIAAHDPDAAETAMREHLAGVERALGAVAAEELIQR
jgi:DNA-binding GntR family transcriptional regulator